MPNQEAQLFKSLAAVKLAQVAIIQHMQNIRDLMGESDFQQWYSQLPHNVRRKHREALAMRGRELRKGK